MCTLQVQKPIFYLYAPTLVEAMESGSSDYFVSEARMGQGEWDKVLKQHSDKGETPLFVHLVYGTDFLVHRLQTSKSKKRVRLCFRLMPCSPKKVESGSRRQRRLVGKISCWQVCSFSLS